MENINQRNIPFSPPDISEAEISEVCAALKDGWITTGKRTKLFEKRIAEYVHTNKAVCLNSATAAMELTLRILGVGQGDEVILPAYTYTATASVVCHVGAKPVMIDCQKNSLEMDYDAVERAINQKTKVVIPVDIGGCMCNYKKLFEIVERKKNLFSPSDNNIQNAFKRIIVMSDSAHGFGAKQNGKMSGEVADFTCFSFHAVKNLTTGEGGACVWRDIDGIDNEWLYKQYMLASLHGQTKDALAKEQLGAWEYDIMYPAYKCNMTDCAAAIGLVQLDRYEYLLSRRRRIIDMYNVALCPLGIEVLSHYSDNAQSSGHLYITRVPGIDDKQRREIIVKMAEVGIVCNVHYKPLPMLTAYKDFGFDIQEYPNSYSHYENEITLPLHTLLSDDDVKYVVENYCRILKEYI